MYLVVLLTRGGGCAQDTVSDTTSSRFHENVSLTLSSLGLRHVNEYVAEQGLFSIDIALLGSFGKVRAYALALINP